MARQFGFLVLAMLSTGCGSGPTTVRGKVTLDGLPVSGGTVSFYSTGEGGRNGSATIVDGEYLTLPTDAPGLGTYRVEISWPKKTGRKLPTADPGVTVDETKEAIPAHYRGEGGQRVEIKPGENKHDFELTTKP